MKSFRRINIDITREHCADAVLRAVAVVEFDDVLPLRCQVALDADDRASVWFSDGPYTTHQLLNVADSVLAAVRKLDALR